MTLFHSLQLRIREPSRGARFSGEVGVSGKFKLGDYRTKRLSSADRVRTLLSVKDITYVCMCVNRFQMMSNQQNLNIMGNLDPVEYQSLRKAIIDIVLATDMRKHFVYLTKFQQCILNTDVVSQYSLQTQLLMIHLSAFRLPRFCRFIE